MTIEQRIEFLLQSTKPLHSQLQEMHGNLRELNVLTRNLYATSLKRDEQIAKHSEQLAIDSEHIRALVRIAEIHNRRLDALEGIEPQS